MPGATRSSPASCGAPEQPFDEHAALGDLVTVVDGPRVGKAPERAEQWAQLLAAAQRVSPDVVARPGVPPEPVSPPGASRGWTPSVSPERVWVCGSRASADRAILATLPVALAIPLEFVEAPAGLAAAVAGVAAREAAQGRTVAPHALHPLYVRRPRRGVGARPCARGQAVMTQPSRAGVVVRRMRIADDLDGMGAVDAASFTNPWTRDMYLWEAQHSDVARVFVAEHPSDGIVGYCAVWVVFDELQVNNLAILPSWRRHGLAHQLLAEVFAAARAEGATCATLEVRASNTPAISLYEGLGFVRTAVRPAYYTHPVEDAWIYWWHDLDRGHAGLNRPRGRW